MFCLILWPVFPVYFFSVVERGPIHLWRRFLKCSHHFPSLTCGRTLLVPHSGTGVMLSSLWSWKGLFAHFEKFLLFLLVVVKLSLLSAISQLICWTLWWKSLTCPYNSSLCCAADTTSLTRMLRLVVPIRNPSRFFFYPSLFSFFSFCTVFQQLFLRCFRTRWDSFFIFRASRGIAWFKRLMCYAYKYQRNTAKLETMFIH